MNIQEYCKKWFIAKRRPIELMTSVDALKLHQSGKPYTVVIRNSVGKPQNLIDVANNTYLVSFFDTLNKVYLTYQFNVVEDKLFLTFATHHEYDVETGKEVEKSIYAFKPDGSLHIEKRDYITSEVATANNSIDVSGNWETLPEFGCYEAITKENRN